MKIGIISDTHGSIGRWKKTWEILEQAEIIIHCGDLFNHGPGNPIPEGYSPKELLEEFNSMKKPFFVIKGNCDSEVDATFLTQPISYPYFFSVFENYRILVTHGHLFKEDFLIEKGRIWKVNFIISGHTHIWKLEKAGDDLVIINPGSPSLPKNNPSCGLIDLKGRKAFIYEIMEKKVLKQENF